MPVLPIVDTGVRIDRLAPDDAPALSVSHSDPDNAVFQGWPSPLAAEDARRFIEAQSVTESLAPGSAVQLAIREAAGGPLAGDLYLRRSDACPGTLEVGITLVPGFHGRGLAAAAIAATVRAAFAPDLPGGPVERVEAVMDVDNVRSRRLFERLGFRVAARHTASGRRRDGTLADELELVMTTRDRRAGLRTRSPRRASVCNGAAMGQDDWTPRGATTDDADEVARLLHDFNAEFDTPSPGVDVLAGRLRDLLAGDDTFAILAGAPGAAVGVALVTLRPNVWFAGPVALLDELYVVPHLRSRGIGSGIIGELMSMARARGVGLVEINVDEGDVDAQRFYERHGFSVIDPDSNERAFYFTQVLDA